MWSLKGYRVSEGYRVRNATGSWIGYSVTAATKAYRRGCWDSGSVEGEERYVPSGLLCLFKMAQAKAK